MAKYSDDSSFFTLFLEFWKTVFDTLKYIFYDLLLGKAPTEGEQN